jgi:hypothetical protein
VSRSFRSRWYHRRRDRHGIPGIAIDGTGKLPQRGCEWAAGIFCRNDRCLAVVTAVWLADKAKHQADLAKALSSVKPL